MTGSNTASYRDFPTRYRDRYGNTVRVFFGVQSVLKDREAEPWWTEDRGNGVRVYMGSGDVTLPPGEYTYSLTHRTDRQLVSSKGHDELYWNATGNAWEFPTKAALPTWSSRAGRQRRRPRPTQGMRVTGVRITRRPQTKGGRAVFAATRPFSRRGGSPSWSRGPRGSCTSPPRRRRHGSSCRTTSAAGGLAGIVALIAY